MKSIDIKSLLIGILGTALVMVLMGQAGGGKNFIIDTKRDWSGSDDEYDDLVLNDTFVKYSPFRGMYQIDCFDGEALTCAVLNTSNGKVELLAPDPVRKIYSKKFDDIEWTNYGSSAGF